MGYTTEFTGTFKLSPKLSLEQIAALQLLHDQEPDEHPASAPRGYCQWTPSVDGEELAWDGEEKFYDYLEWLEFILDTYLVPSGIAMNGEVWWRGEDSTDVGIITADGMTFSTRKPSFKKTETK